MRISLSTTGAKHNYRDTLETANAYVDGTSFCGLFEFLGLGCHYLVLHYDQISTHNESMTRQLV